ncbi:Zein-binding domain containing protein [Trema orientale]|uniref:Zein-binding domain containing protein n=1 Tax=Trema orientale TaxID=63057 RepID=A0A2P5FNH4_TREOI|nr:Zein-binding domain containing protein [Trema orientale]
MAEGSTFSGMSEADIIALKETLQAQQQLLQKLYAELDQEREASASAASEALSMILRLQGEKAAVKMEASQYKRLAEEKICHAEESLAMFEDLIYQKEMEIASLEFQVQAYKCKLLSLGCNDLVGGESKFPENLLLQGGDLWKGDSYVSGNVRRFSSLPPIPIKDSHYKKGTIEREKSANALSDLVQKKVDHNGDQEISVHGLDSEKKSGYSSGGTFNSYWQQIKMLDEQVKEISHCKDSGREKVKNLKSRSRSCSLPPQVSIGTSCDISRLETVKSLDQVKHSDDLRESETIVNPSCSSSVQDIFEVPKLKENHNTCEQQNKGQSKMTEGVENKLGKLDLTSQETGRFCLTDEVDSVKTMLNCTSNESNLSKPRVEMSFDCDVALVHPTIGVAESQAKFQQLFRRVERLEGERNGVSQEITYAGEEERKLLRDIQEQLNTIQAEISSWTKNKTPVQDEEPSKKKTPVQDDQSVHCLKEALLHFWL